MYKSFSPQKGSIPALILAVALSACVALYAQWASWALAGQGSVVIHAGLETLAIVLTCLTFAVGWHGQGAERSAAMLICTAVMPWVATQDFFHMLSYAGSGLGDQQQSAFFDLSGRSLASLALIAAAAMIGRPLPYPHFGKGVFAAAGLIALAAVGWGLGRLPVLTAIPAVNDVAQWALVLINLAAVLLLGRQHRLQNQTSPLVQAAAMALLAANTVFAFPVATDSAFFVLGHSYKILAYGLIYRAVYLENVRSPYVRIEQSRDRLRKREEAIRHSEAEYRLAIDSVREVIFRVSAAGRWQFLNQSWTVLTGYSVEESLGQPFVDFLVEDERDRIGARFLGLVGGQMAVSHHETRYKVKGGGFRWVEVHSRSLYNDQGEVLGTLGTLNDITERKRAEELNIELNEVLTMVAADKGLREVLNRLASLIEHRSEGGLCSFMLLDSSGKRFQSVFAPSLPEAYSAELVGLAIGPEVGSCGTAAWHNEPVMVADVNVDARWQAFRPLTQQHKLTACSSWPICGRRGEVMATLAIYFRTPRTPTPEEIRVIEPAIDLARIAIESAETEERIRYLAHHDDLTSLPNRVAFNECLQHFLSLAQRHQRQGAVMFIDLDRFKLVNDTLGHDAGDWVLRQASERIASSLRDSDTVARIGGDEFYVLLEEYDDPADIRTVATRILTAMARPFSLSGHDFHLTASIGVSTYPEDGADGQALMKNADIAMYRAKKLGKNTYQFYSEEMNEHTLERLELESRLRRSMDQDELVLHYQPKLDIVSGRVIGVEALMRWRNPDGSLVPPMDFIPLAEETGLIVPMSRWALVTACRQSLAWQNQGLELTVAVNLSARHFRQKDIVADVARALEISGLPGRLLELEITESMVMENPEEAVTIMQALKYMGVSLSIDDFGTGYSSLAYLKRFPVDSVKIDRSFIRDIPEDEDDVAITQATLAMARSLKLKVVAEGVETLAQRDFLAHQGCDQFQGYLLARPLKAEEILAFVTDMPAPGCQQFGYKRQPAVRH